jgi:fumarate reductase subunit C
MHSEISIHRFHRGSEKETMDPGAIVEIESLRDHRNWTTDLGTIDRGFTVSVTVFFCILLWWGCNPKWRDCLLQLNNCFIYLQLSSVYYFTNSFVWLWNTVSYFEVRPQILSICIKDRQMKIPSDFLSCYMQQTWRTFLQPFIVNVHKGAWAYYVVLFIELCLKRKEKQN